MANESAFMSEDAVMLERIFLCTEGDASKFWRVRVKGSVQTVHYGRIGTEGHELTKTFDDATLASKATDKLIREKLGKGYREVSEQEASAAQEAARPSESATVSSVPKTRRASKRSPAPLQQLALFFDDGEADGLPTVAWPIAPTAVALSPALTLEL